VAKNAADSSSEIAVSAQKPKRVLFIENSLHTTGAWVSGLSMMEELAPYCKAALLLPKKSTLNGPVELFELGEYRLRMIQIGRAWRKLLLYLPCLLLDAWQLFRLLKQLQIDVLIVNDYYNLLGGVMRCMGWRGRLVVWVKLRPSKQHPVLNKLWVAVALRSSDIVAVVSDAVARDLPADSKVRKLGNPHNLIECHPDLSDPPSEESGIRFLFPANYIQGKGHDLALRALAMAHRRNGAIRLRFVGSDMGLEKNRQYKNDLRMQAEVLGLSRAVEFGDFSTDIERDMKSSHVVLNFSESESFSNTCLEAGFFHRPVIATRCGGPEEILEEGVTGFLVDLEDVKQMAGRMLQLAQDAELRHRMGEAAHLRAGKLFVHIDSKPMCNSLLGIS
jgi:L-malate glycosyltransferase